MEQPPILITGASSGIGKSCELFLCNSGYNVFAGVRNQRDGETLINKSSGKITPQIIDVTDLETINVACKKISEVTGNKLFALINNAGTAYGGPLELLPVADFKKLLR